MSVSLKSHLQQENCNENSESLYSEAIRNDLVSALLKQESTYDENHYASAGSIAVIGLVTFVGDSSRGLIYPALWPLCQRLGGNKVDLGWLVATFSIGRLVISTSLGKFADIYRHRSALVLSNIVLMIGAIIWANSANIGGLVALYVGQFVMGLGTGSLGVTRSYIVEQTAPNQRTYSLARLSALQYAGFSMTPLVGAALVVAGGSISPFWEYALPAYLIGLLGLLCIITLYYPFEDIKDDDNYNRNMTTAVIDTDITVGTLSEKLPINSRSVSRASNESKTTGTFTYSQRYDLVAASEDETLLRPLTNYSNEHNSSKTKSLDTEIKFSHQNEILSPVSLNDLNNPTELEDQTFTIDRNRVFTLMVWLNFATRGAIAVYETQSSQILLGLFGLSELSLGTIVSCAGLFGTIQLIFFKEIWTKNFSNMELMMGGLALMAIPQFLIIQFGAVDKLGLWRFLLPLYLVYGIGYPVGNSGILGIFSMLQKSGRQAAAQGQFAFMGSLARVVIPVISGYFEQYVEESSSFSIVLIMMSISSVAIIALYHKILYFINLPESSDIDVNRNQKLNLIQYVIIAIYIVFIIISIGAIFDLAGL